MGDSENGLSRILAQISSVGRLSSCVVVEVGFHEGDLRAMTICSGIKMVEAHGLDEPLASVVVRACL